MNSKTGRKTHSKAPVSRIISDGVVDRDCERIPPSSGRGRADTAATIHGRRLGGISNRNRFCVAPCNRGCYGIGEMPAPNHKGRRTDGGSHGNDTDFDGVVRESEILVITKIEDFRTTSLTGPQPYTGEETRVPPVCCRFPVSAGWNLERHARRKSDGRIPRPLGRGGGQSPASIPVLARVLLAQTRVYRRASAHSPRWHSRSARSKTPLEPRKQSDALRQRRQRLTSSTP